MIDWYLKVLKDNYANFSGRAKRSEYWYFTLCQAIIFSFLIFLAIVFEGDNGYIPLIIYAIATALPYFGVLVRRLHDSGKSGGYYFVRLIPLVGPVWLLVLLCTDGDMGSNEYGEDPKRTYNEFDQIGTKEDNF